LDGFSAENLMISRGSKNGGIDEMHADGSSVIGVTDPG
jgi:hypothetical protein